MSDSVITCNKVIESYIEESKTILTNFHKKKATCKTQNFYYILLAFLLVAIALLIDISIYCYLIKYQAKQKQVL